MFVLVEMKDNVRIAPRQFHLNLMEAIPDELNRKLANKVILDIGLCIALRDIIAIKDSIILPGDGASYTETVFRYIVFRPTIGSVCTGKVKACNAEGVHVTLGFFDDILIPSSALPHSSRFEEAEKAWIWEYTLENNTKHKLFIDIGDSIKFRVTHEIFEDCSPDRSPFFNENVEEQPETSSAKKQNATTATKAPYNVNNTEIHENHMPIGSSVKDVNMEEQPGCSSANQQGSAPKTPYKILGAINEVGLGVLAWWEENSQNETKENTAEQNNTTVDEDVSVE